MSLPPTMPGPIEELDNGGVVYGPQRVLRELLAVQDPVWAPTGGWWLEAAHLQPGPLWKTERVNLKQLDSEAGRDFRSMPYRFLAHADYLRQLPTSVRAKLWNELGLTQETLNAAVSHA